MQSTFIVMMSFVLGNFYHSILLQAISTTTSATVTYFLARGCMNKFFKKKYENDILYKVASDESKNNPWRINLMFRIMYIPVTFKNVILALCETNLVVYLICLIPAIFFFGTIYTMIGLGLNNINDFFKPRDFKEKTTFEKVKIIVGYIILIATIFIMVWICMFTRKKMREYKDKESSTENGHLLGPDKSK